MGIRVSSWELAREVSRQGELGVVSGTGMDTVFIRTLQLGDASGYLRRALATFPDQDMVARITDKYFVEGGKAVDKPFRSLPMWTVAPSQHLQEVTVLANYCEVWLAKHNDDGSPIEKGIVGINRLTKVQLPTLYSLYGAILADVDYVIMGAGIPLQIPAALDNLSEGKDALFPVDVESSEEKFVTKLSPVEFWSNAGKPDLVTMQLKRPAFIPIVSSVVLAQSMLKKTSGKGPTKGIDGFVVELPTAGGHNAPPRGFKYDPAAKSHALALNSNGEPIYGEKDEVALEKFKKAAKGLPFWLAGSFAHSEKVKEVVELGGAGVQVGTMFALAKESGLDPTIRDSVLKSLAEHDMDVFTDPAASPTGYPFKVLEIERTLSNPEVYQNRHRHCSLGYLRQAYIDKQTGKLGYKCPAEPLKDYVKKGGEADATLGRKCLCNALMANVGLPQTRTIKETDAHKNDLYTEEPLITIGDEVNECKRFLRQDDNGKWGYEAKDVVQYLKSDLKPPTKQTV